MKRLMAIGVVLLASAMPALPAQAQLSAIRVATCARTITSGMAPFAVAAKMGWFREEGLEVTLVPMAGSSDCVKAIATREVPYALAAVEAHATALLQGIKAHKFFTAYQGNIYSLAVPAESDIAKVADLKGRTIGVISMGGGVLFAKALVASAGLDPERDVRIVVAGEGAQTAAMVRGRQVDALSQFDTQYALVENAGVRLRLLETKDTDRFPGNGFLALDETLRTHRREAVGLGRAYAKGTVFAISNPEAAVRILYEVYPELRPTGKDEAAAIRDDVRVLQARIANWRLEKGGVSRWGESSEANYAAYVDFLLKWGVIGERMPVGDMITNELIGDINAFDSARIVAQARALGSQ